MYPGTGISHWIRFGEDFDLTSQSETFWNHVNLTVSLQAHVDEEKLHSAGFPQVILFVFKY